MGLFPALIGAGAQLLGGVMANRGQERARRQSIADRNEQRAYDRDTFVRLREDAEKAGFNPLTALSATGGSYGAAPTPPALSSGQFIADAIGRAVDTGFNVYADGQDRQQRELDRQEQARIANLEFQRASAPYSSFGYGLTASVAVPGQREAGPPAMAEDGQVENLASGQPHDRRPQARPTWRDADRIPVTGPTGENYRIPRRTAERLGIETWDILTPGEMTELVGEIYEVEAGVGTFAVRETNLGADNGILGVPEPRAFGPTPPVPMTLPPLRMSVGQYSEDRNRVELEEYIRRFR